MPQLADDLYSPITSDPVPTAEEMARRNRERIAYEKEIERRRDELLKQSRREAFGDKVRDTVMLNGIETPLQEAFARIPAQMEFENRMNSSPLLQRALRRNRVDELTSDGLSREKAEAQAQKEQEGRDAAFKKGQQAVRSESSNVDKEARTFAESVTGSVGAPLARMFGQRQMANEAEARSAGVQSEMSKHRSDKYAHPDIAGAAAGAIQNVAQMGPGVAASMLGGPQVGMVMMAGQYGTQEYSRAVYDGEEAGLAGKELDNYAAVQGGVEATIMPIMSKIPGLGGIEGRVLTQNLARKVVSNPSVLKAIAKGGALLARDTATEVVEEVLTEVLHGVATETMLNEGVDYKAVLKDTVLQTVMMMGITEGTQQAGRLVSSGGPGDGTQRPAPDSFTQIPIDEQIAARDAAAAGEAAPPVTPEVEAFKKKPSETNYDAAVKAGMPPIEKDGKPIEKPNRAARGKYAADMRTPQPVPEEAPPATNPAPVQDNEYDQLLSQFLEEDVEDAAQDKTSQEPETSTQGQPVQGRQEGLLTEPETQDIASAFGNAGAAIVDNFYAAVLQSIKSTGEVPPQERKSSVGKAWEQAKAAGMSPEDFITQLQTPKPEASPVATGEPSPDQSPESAGPVSKMSQFLDLADQETGRPRSETFRNDLAQAIQENATKAIKDGAFHSMGGEATPRTMAKMDAVREYLESQGHKVGPVTHNAQAGTSSMAIEPAKKLELPEHARLDQGDDGLFYPGWDKPGKLPQTAMMGFKTPEEAMTWFEKKPPKNTPVPSAEPPKGSIGWSNSGLPIYESKTGLRTVGNETEQAASLKDVKGQMQAVLPGPREDRFKTEAELAAPKRHESAIKKYPPKIPHPDDSSREVDAPPVYLTGVSNDASRKAAKDMPNLGVMVTPRTQQYRTHLKDYQFFGVDNGAFTQKFNEKGFYQLLDNIREQGDAGKALFATAPDVVGDWQATLKASEPHLDRIRDAGFPVAIVLQNGATVETIPWDRIDALFVGGDDNFKLAQKDESGNIDPKGEMLPIIKEARRRDVPIHYGRVNSAKRMETTHFGMAGRSMDGTFLKFGQPDEQTDKVMSWLKPWGKFPAKQAPESTSTETLRRPAAPKKPIGPVNPANEHSLRTIVLRLGGIKTKSLLKDYKYKDLRSDGLLGVSRVKGQPLDEVAQMLMNSGDLRVPDNRTPADWLVEQLKANADGARAEYSDKDIEAQLEAEREAHEQLKETLKTEGIDSSGLEELRQNSIEAGFHEEGEIGDEKAQELIDTSFDFGANVAARVGDIVEFTDRQGKKQVGLLTKFRPDGRVFIEPERRTDSVGRPTSTRYSGMELRGPGEFKKVGTSPFPATLNQFYSKWDGKSEQEIQSEFTVLWDSLDADDKGRLAGRLRKFGISAKVNNKTDKLAEAVAARLVDSRDIPGKIREIYDIAMEYPNLQGMFENPDIEAKVHELTVRIDSVGLTLPPMVRASMILPEARRELLHNLARTQFGQEIADALFDDVPVYSALEDATTDDEDKKPSDSEETFSLKRPEKPKPKAEDFGTNPNSKQGGLFDAGKKGDLPGQELLFNSDPGDLNNPKTQENKPKPEAKAPESDIKAAMRAELAKQAAEEAAAKEPAKPKTPKAKTPKPKTAAISAADQRKINVIEEDGGFNAAMSTKAKLISQAEAELKKADSFRKPTVKDNIARSKSELAELRRLFELKYGPPGDIVVRDIATGNETVIPVKKPRTKLGEKLGKKSKETGKAAKQSWDDFLEEAGDIGILSGINNKALVATAKMVRAQVADGVVKFADLVERIVSYSSPAMARKLSDYLEAAWEILGETNSELDPAGKVADVLGPDKDTDTETAWSTIPGHFAEQLINGERYKSITEARSEASEIVGQPIKPGTAEAKRLDEAIEYGIVQAGRKIVSDGGTPSAIFDKLVDLYARQPVLGVRDSNSMEMQAYSTPVPLAWLVSNLGHVTAQTKVYEPTAGNGVLLIGTDVKNAFVNELDRDRAQTLRDQGFKVTQNDAVTHAVPDVQTVLANPPFGKIKDADRKTITLNVDGFKTTEIDHAIALQSLKAMQPEGHTVLILAAKGLNAPTELARRKDYRGRDKPFYDALYEGYDVTEHFTVDGSLYSRQGASFPVDVIVLRPLGTVPVDQKRATPWAKAPRIFNSWGELKNAFFNDSVADSSEGSGVLTGDGNNGSADISTRNTDDVGRVPGQDENAAPVDEGDVGSGKPESVVSTPVDGKNGDRRGSTKSGGPRTQSGFSGTAANERSGQGAVSDAGNTEPVGDGVDSGTGSDGVAGTSTAESEVDPETHQSTYTPSSKNKTVDTLVPTNLQDAISMALANVEDRNGPIDAFVQKELGYKKKDKFFTDLSAEQVDALALAIDSHKRGGGMVVGDMTGVGKGRVAAAIMRYAERQGLVPVFVTEKPDLFGDIYRDLADIGSDSPENPFFAQTTNNTSGADAIDLPDGRKLQTSKETAMARITEGLASLAAGKGFMADVDGVPTKINAVFTMYSQLQTLKGAETQRRQLLRELMPHAFLIMDESHNAGGTVKARVNANAPPDRAALARELVQMSAGTMYLSATFAKRPDVMSLYSKTDMAKAVNGDISKLADVLRSGGLPLQQVLSAMLAETGQYIRREKSFDGVEFAKVDVNVDLAEQDKITDVFRHIRTLDNVIKEVVENLNDDLVAAGEHGVAGDVSTGDAGLTSNSFSSILWNAVDQMLFALKADKAADEAIASWNGGKDTLDKNGVVTKKSEVPILAVDNTMESIIDEYVEANGLKVGDVVNLNFRDILHRYLERSRWMTVDTGQRKPNGKKITRKQRLTDAQLNVETHGGNALALFQQAYAVVESTDVNAPASPIDWLRHRMETAGMKVAEITGRKTILIYSADGVAKLGARPKAEKGTRGKQNTIRRINAGSLDGLLLNRSGATGVSVHASEKFKNQKVRHMIIVQAAKNIDEFMQMLGRINRTGQVVLPRYSLLMSDSPAELRPAAVLSKKLSSLNASVTAKSKGAVGFDVVDVMNQVGGRVVSEYLDANPNFAYALDMYDDANQGQTDDTDDLEDIVRKATGRSAILPIVQQREFWEDVTLAYNARIAQLNATNSNPLIAQTLNLNAKTISTLSLFAGEPNEGPFAAPANLERMDIKSLGKPMSPEEVNSEITEFYGIGDMKDRFTAAGTWSRSMKRTLTDEMVPFRVEAMKNFVNPEAIASRNKVLDEQFKTVTNAIREFPPGTIVEEGVVGFALEGVVIGFRRTGKTGNPVAPSRWMIDVAVNDGSRKLTIPVSQMKNLRNRTQSLDSLMADFQTGQSVSREKRWMGTGNLMAAYAKLASSNGKIIFYTDATGETKRGIIMPRHFDAGTFIENQPVQFTKPDDILRFFARGGRRMTSEDGVLTVTFSSGNSRMALIAPRARSVGGKYTLNHGIITAAGQQFVSVGNTMSVGSSDRATQYRMLEAVLELTPLQVNETDSRILAREVLGLTKTGQPIETESPDSEPDTVAEPEPESDTSATPVESEARKSAREAQEAVDAQKAENARLNKIIVDELRKDSLMGAGIPVSKELATAVAGRMLGSIRLGVKRFDALIKELRADFEESVVTALKPKLISGWNSLKDKYGLDNATEAVFDAAMSSTVDVDVEQAVAAMTPEPASNVAEDDKTYSTKNEYTDAERQRLDMPERPPVERQGREESIDLAATIGKSKAGSDRIDNLIEELKQFPRALKPLEYDLLNFRYAELDGKVDDALKAQIAAQEEGNDTQEAVNEQNVRKHLQAMREMIEFVNEPTGSASGRSLQARKAVIKRDFTMARSLLLFEAAHKRKAEPAEREAMQKQIDDLNASIASLEAKLAEADAKYNDLETRLKESHETAVVDVSKKPAAPPEPAPAPAPKTPAEKSRKEKTRAKIEDAYKRIKAMLQEGTAFSVGGALGEAGSAFLDLATGYSELGVITLGEFLNRVGKRMGPEAKKLREPLTAAWKQVRASLSGPVDISRITDKIDAYDPDTIGRAARDLHRYVIERDGLDASPEGREAAVDAVHEILLDFVPLLTRTETARAMSGIGIYSELSKDDIEVVRRDQKAQLLSLEQISDWKQGTPPPATGQERPPVSDEQRALRKMVNEAKKASGVSAQTEGQLRSALDAAKRMAKNRITDLDKALAPGGKRITRSKTVLIPDAELTALQEKRDALQKRYDEAFGRPELSEEQRLNRAEKVVDLAIADLEADLKAGKLYKDAPKAKVTSFAIEAKRDALNALKATRDELRVSTGEAQARSDAAYARHLKEKIADLSKRLAEKDYAPKPKKPEREYTPEMLADMQTIEKQKQAINKERKEWEFSQRHIVYKTWIKGPVATAHMIRKAKTSYDQSLIGRQGGLLGVTNPRIWARAAKASFASNPIKAKSIWTTEQELFNLQTALDADANAVRMEKIAKLEVTDVHGGVNREEDSRFVPEWFDELPGIGSSERGGSAFINMQRRLVFRSLVEKLATILDGKRSISNAELRVIGNFVNVSSGRGTIGSYTSALDSVTTVFFSPRWWASRINVLSGQPIWHGARWTGENGASAEVRKMIAIEWAKQAAAQVAIMSLAVAALTAAFGPPGDDEEWDWYWNWKSPKFGNIRIGNSYIDLTFGLSQHVSYLVRMLTGKQIDRWETRDIRSGELFGKYLRGKLSPVSSVIGDYLVGKSIGQEEFGSAEWYWSQIMPLMGQDIDEAMGEGPVLGSALSLLMFFGGSSQTYEARVKERKDIANELRAMKKQGKSPEKIKTTLDKHLAHAAAQEAKQALRTADPDEVAGLQKVIDSKASPELEAAIQKERYDIILNASGRVSSDPKRFSEDKEFSGSDDKSRLTSRELIPLMIPNVNDAIALYEDAYRAKNRTLYERGKIKESVFAGRARIRSLYKK